MDRYGYGSGKHPEYGSVATWTADLALARACICSEDNSPSAEEPDRQVTSIWNLSTSILLKILLSSPQVEFETAAVGTRRSQVVRDDFPESADWVRMQVDGRDGLGLPIVTAGHHSAVRIRACVLRVTDLMYRLLHGTSSQDLATRIGLPASITTAHRPRRTRSRVQDSSVPVSSFQHVPDWRLES